MNVILFEPGQLFNKSYCVIIIKRTKYSKYLYFLIPPFKDIEYYQSYCKLLLNVFLCAGAKNIIILFCYTQSFQVPSNIKSFLRSN